MKWQDISVDIKTFLKLATNDRSDKMFLLTSYFITKVSTPALGLYIHVQNHEKICIKSDFKEIFFKFATNDRSDKMFLLTSYFITKGSAPALGLYIHV